MAARLSLAVGVERMPANIGVGVRARTVACALLFSALALPAGAQIIGPPPSQGGARPVVWLSGGIGLAVLQTVIDGETQTSWFFGNGVQYRGTLEYDIGSAASLGVAVGYSRMPLRYSANPGAGQIPGCDFDCDAHADVWTTMAVLHAGAQQGFHQVIDVSLGAVRYSNFTEDATGQELAPSSDTDLSFAIGYGFGYSLPQAISIYVVQDAVLAVHQRSGLRGDQRSFTQHYYTRLGLRLGVGRR